MRLSQVHYQPYPHEHPHEERSPHADAALTAASWLTVVLVAWGAALFARRGIVKLLNLRGRRSLGA